MTWAEIARVVFASTGHDPARVTDVSTEEFFASAAGPVAPRPRGSVLDLVKSEAAGVELTDSRIALERYLGG